VSVTAASRAARLSSAGRVRALRAAAAAAAAAASVPYVLAAAGPLRLQDDGIVYLSLARSLVTGARYRPPGIDFPRGYPALLATLEWLGIDRVWTFVLLNLVFVALGLACAYLLFRDAFGLSEVAALGACLAVLVAHELVTAAATPASDPTFFGVAMAVLLLVERSFRAAPRRAWLLLLAAAALVAAAVEIRSIGVALLAPLAVGVVRRAGRHAAVLAAAVLALTAAAAALAVAGTGYGAHVRDGWHVSQGAGAMLAELPRQLHAKLDTVAAVAANISPDHWPGSLSWAMPVAGAAALALVAVGLAGPRRLGAPQAFLVGATLVLFVWPENSTRLLIPVLAPAAGAMLVALRSLWHRWPLRVLAAAWAVAFAVAGGATLVHSVLLDESGARFPEKWKVNRPELTASYEIAYGQLARGSGVPYDADALRLLLRYRQAIPGR
jgi:hypothetical protein